MTKAEAEGVHEMVATYATFDDLRRIDTLAIAMI